MSSHNRMIATKQTASGERPWNGLQKKLLAIVVEHGLRNVVGRKLFLNCDAAQKYKVQIFVLST